MIDIDKWQEIFSTLKSNKLRTFLTAFGVFWGIFMLVIMLGSGNGLKNGVMQGFGDFATNSVFIWPQVTSISYKGFPRGRQFSFINEDIAALRKNIPEIELIAPRVRGGSMDGGGDNVVRGQNSGAFSIFGDYPEFNLIDPVQIVKGRFINNIDIKQKRKVIVIGKRVLEVLFEKDEKVLGEYIRIQGVYFKVVGVYASKRFGERANRENQRIFMPFTTLQQTYNMGNTVGWFSITSKDNILVSNIEDKIINLLKNRHSISPKDKDAIGHFNVEKEYKQMNGLFNGISTLIWIVGTGTLLAGVIGVSNIMLIIVKERTKEIGIKRAIGATPVKIVGQIITESVFLTSFAGYFGLSLGVFIVELINMAMEGGGGGMFANPEVDLNVALFALTILVFSGAVAGFIPAKRAISIKPIDALRNE